MADNHLEMLQLKMTQAWEHLNSIWLQVGYDEDLLLRRRNAVKKHVQELLEEMCQEADCNFEEFQKEIKELMAEIMQLAKDLTIDDVPELATAAGKPLLEMKRIFTDVASVLRKQKGIRMEKYNKINAMVIELSDELDESPMQIEFEGIPADSQVNKLEHHLGGLHRERRNRLEQLDALKKSIAEVFDLLERQPQTEMECLILQPEDPDISTVTSTGIKTLSMTTLNALQDVEQRAIHQLEANSKQGIAYWQKIHELWARLGADEEMMQIFAGVHKPIRVNQWEGFTEVYKPSVLKGLQKELERLEEEKRQNMSLFIRQCREELAAMWVKKCFMTSVQDRFMEANYLGITPFTITDFNSDVYSEELLEKHESELEYWKSFIERNKKIIEWIEKRDEMFAQYKVLDQKSDDPSRLANRGGALLKEEKERKRLEKAIPKLEAELKKLCDQFEAGQDEGHGMQKFLVYGRSVDEMIEQDWEQFNEDKRLRKEAKKNPTPAAGNKTMMTTQLGNPALRKRPATPSSAQRGAVTPSKRNKTTALTPGKTLPSPFAQPGASGSSAKRPFTNMQPPPSSSYGAVRTFKTPNKPAMTRQNTASKLAVPQRVTGKEQIPPSSSSSEKSIISPVSSYSEFTDHLLCTSTLNSSTVVPIQKHVQGANGGAAPTTPTKSTLALAAAKVPLSDNCF